mgnify:CR=1 FL=1
MARFTVDTHLFRELGELLVGRDSTALIELVKNSYDADATVVEVYGESLDSPLEGRIVIADNGTGMTLAQFERGFLRIASRQKEEGSRQSTRYGRRFTGEKGIGRLAAHKLARVLQIDSIPLADASRTTREALHAVIDWDDVERYETLDDLSDSSALQVATKEVEPGADSGTTLTLGPLRRAWTKTELTRFFSEVQSFEPAPFLLEPLPETIAAGPILFGSPLVREAEQGNNSFRVNLEGNFAVGDQYWELMAHAAAWIIEIRASKDSGLVDYAIAPTRQGSTKYKSASVWRCAIDHPSPEEGPFFDARIFVREGRAPMRSSDQRVWASGSSGVRVFMEGFRVLPYGDAGDDWLKLDADYTRRTRTLEALDRWGLGQELARPEDLDDALSHVPSNNYFGAVFLVHRHAPKLRLLVNREGFVPDQNFEHLRELTRVGIDLCTRVRAANSFEARQTRKELRNQGGRRSAPPHSEQPSAPGERLKSWVAGASLALDQARQEAEKEQCSPALAARIAEGQRAVAGFLSEADEFVSEQSLLRVLASVGTQMAAFVHELNSLLAVARATEATLRRLSLIQGLGPATKTGLIDATTAAGDLCRGLERQASYFADLLSPDARRRRSRQSLRDRFDSALKLLSFDVSTRNITVKNSISADVLTPAMFPAEVMAVILNVLTNAIKAAGRDGRIRATATSSKQGVIRMRLSNTGVGVDLVESERWFRPFESTTLEVNPILGQGMGLGLPITRGILSEYGAEARFIEPEVGFATTVEILFQP